MKIILEQKHVSMTNYYAGFNPSGKISDTVA